MTGSLTSIPNYFKYFYLHNNFCSLFFIDISVYKASQYFSILNLLLSSIGIITGWSNIFSSAGSWNYDT